MDDKERIRELEAVLERIINTAQDSLQGYDRHDKWQQNMRKIISIADSELNHTQQGRLAPPQRSE